MKKTVCLFLIMLVLPYLGCFAQAESSTPQMGSQKDQNQHKTVQVLGDKATINIPSSFEKMTEQQIATKYVKADPRPKEIWYFDTGESVITLSFTMPYPDKELIDEHVPMLAEIMKNQMADLKPILTTKKVNGHTVSRLETVAKDISGDGTTVHSILQLSSLDERLLMTTFNVSAQLKDNYYIVGEAALDSLTY